RATGCRPADYRPACCRAALRRRRARTDGAGPAAAGRCPGDAAADRAAADRPSEWFCRDCWDYWDCWDCWDSGCPYLLLAAFGPPGTMQAAVHAEKLSPARGCPTLSRDASAVPLLGFQVPARDLRGKSRRARTRSHERGVGLERGQCARGL